MLLLLMMLATIQFLPLNLIIISVITYCVCLETEYSARILLAACYTIFLTRVYFFGFHEGWWRWAPFPESDQWFVPRNSPGQGWLSRAWGYDPTARGRGRTHLPSTVDTQTDPGILEITSLLSSFNPFVLWANLVASLIADTSIHTITQHKSFFFLEQWNVH